jgi:hypothetical protein
LHLVVTRVPYGEFRNAPYIQSSPEPIKRWALRRTSRRSSSPWVLRWAGCQVYFSADKAARLSSFDCCEHVLFVEEELSAAPEFVLAEAN